MLDFNRNYYEETCTIGSTRYPRFEPKPGKDDICRAGYGIPATFRVEESNADEKRSCSCRAKSTSPSTSH